ncbi:MAG: hypothetical protein LBL95_05165, partial [Deltaproteobacteria bacterium]|nr:hypothetical protein [Deltaproteobacteria bacterium]
MRWPAVWAGRIPPRRRRRRTAKTEGQRDEIPGEAAAAGGGARRPSPRGDDDRFHREWPKTPGHRHPQARKAGLSLNVLKCLARSWPG